MARPFRFGVVTGGARSRSAWLDQVRRIEALGFDTLVMPDNLAHLPAVFPALAAAAAVTERLHLGTYVLANDLRHPVLVAKEAATLAMLSDGRFELGLGAGRPDAALENRMLGLPFDQGGVRLERLEESIGIIRRLLAGETVTARGTHYTVDDAVIALRAEGAPPVPLLVAASRPRMLRLAGRVADGVALGVGYETTEQAKATLVEQVRVGAGGRFDDLELDLNLMAVGGIVPRFLAGRVDPEALAARGSVAVVSGTPADMADQLRQRRETLGVSYLLVGEELADAFAPVAELLRDS
ncbi:TIGR03621 family F420-dependent LLM class oxidoreductase [Nocardioides sp. CER19]|uniref:TIGR03621 family F420-dependent LLM class oxidoreductase n=1 Tax=Nocardioides sp. CER19 TaxID=3038538 RepID=UPI00244C49D6|nr:TIGR03621 family F420-dependent LLM class oxidoreductase [Nocardioides sp. CER19]MDH2416426.1 TIGR03621 family F420-dependent LLM class oxidoreductase [Nocardioides sp. CER19]